jgi:AraC-like DNA-binding protein
MMATVKTLHVSPIVSIDDYTCTAELGHCGPEETATADEIVLVRRGIFTKSDRDGTHVADPTRVVLFQRSDPYSIYHPNCNGDCSIILSFTNDILSDALDRQGFDPDFPLDGFPTTVPVSGQMLLMYQLLVAAMQNVENGDLFLDEITLNVLAAFRQIAMSEQTNSQSAKPSWFRTSSLTREILCARFDQAVSISGLAREIGLSPFHLCRTFKSSTGMTIHNYVSVLRLSAALERIGDYRTDLATLAIELGYSSHSHFSSVFGKFFGVTPSTLAGLSKKQEVIKRLKAILDDIR